MLKWAPKGGYTALGVEVNVLWGGLLNEHFVLFVILFSLYLFCMKLILLCGGLRQR